MKETALNLSSVLGFALSFRKKIALMTPCFCKITFLCVHRAGTGENSTSVSSAVVPSQYLIVWL